MKSKYLPAIKRATSNMDKYFDAVCRAALIVKIIEKRQIERFLDKMSLARPPMSDPQKQPNNKTATMPPVMALGTFPSILLPNVSIKLSIVRIPEITPV